MILGIDASRANSDTKTGIEWYSYQIIQELKKILSAKALAKEGIPEDVGVVLYTNKPLKGRLANLPPNWQEKILKWPLKYLWTQGRFSFEMLSNPPDILFVPSSAIPIICPKKTFTTIHDIGFKPFWECYKLLARFYLDWSTRLALKKCVGIFTPSNFTKNELVKYYNADTDKVNVTPLAPIQQTQVLKSETLINEEFILFVGRLLKKKNVPRIIEAFKLFKSENLDSKLKLFLVGPKGDVKVKTGGDIAHFDYLPPSEISFLLKNARALLFPSLYEGFGLPILEAFAAGTPVITSKGISTEEVARDAALMVNPENILEIKDAIAQIVSDDNLRQSLVQKGEARLKDFNWSQTAELTFNTIKNFI